MRPAGAAEGTLHRKLKVSRCRASVVVRRKVSGQARTGRYGTTRSYQLCRPCRPFLSTVLRVRRDVDEIGFQMMSLPGFPGYRRIISGDQLEDYLRAQRQRRCTSQRR